MRGASDPLDRMIEVFDLIERAVGHHRRLFASAFSGQRSADGGKSRTRIVAPRSKRLGHVRSCRSKQLFRMKNFHPCFSASRACTRVPEASPVSTMMVACESAAMVLLRSGVLSLDLCELGRSIGTHLRRLTFVSFVRMIHRRDSVVLCRFAKDLRQRL